MGSLGRDRIPQGRECNGTQWNAVEVTGKEWLPTEEDRSAGERRDQEWSGLGRTGVDPSRTGPERKVAQGKDTDWNGADRIPLG